MPNLSPDDTAELAKLKAEAAAISSEGSKVEPTPLDNESVFERVADYVSAAMGRPTNIMVWLFLVIAWTLLFATGAVNPSGSFLPAWFSSEGFNFPLNLVTTVAELFIGFLVAAASNRSERNLDNTLDGIAAQNMQIEKVEDGLQEALNQNTLLTKQIHGLVVSNNDLTKAVHDLLALKETGTVTGQPLEAKVDGAS